MTHPSSRICAYCNNDKPWIWNEKKLKDGSKIYIDDSGRRWAGRRCPDCERSRVHAAVRCDSFEKEIIIKQLEDSGYAIKSKTLPLKVIDQDGCVKTVGIKRAFTENGQITIESSVDEDADVFALVFESVRICSADQMKKLSPNLEIYTVPVGKRPEQGQTQPDQLN
jgi:hypothetical protein